MHIPEDMQYEPDNYMYAPVCTVHPEHGAGKWRDIGWVDQHLQNAQKDLLSATREVRRVAKVHLQCKLMDYFDKLLPVLAIQFD
ncbi:hypothetical protein QJS10_CPB20g00971 [Acorus calamus]|uniref:Uncharacterized protein n=1 Tax=Acorus calamus TaxID=4465 RepID=A0AAV9C8S7_ACOCL|nr:hypothetical protein QJS10_CPB20g00971 [Acorus calamus]